MGNAVHSGLPLLHHFQQGALGLGAGAVNLIGQQQIAEDVYKRQEQHSASQGGQSEETQGNRKGKGGEKAAEGSCRTQKQEDGKKQKLGKKRRGTHQHPGPVSYTQLIQKVITNAVKWAAPINFPNVTYGNPRCV